eukprot:39823-Eustigmatos_ZCMA.PRE.1
MEQGFTRLAVRPSIAVWIVRLFFAFMSLRSRVFSLLDNSRPKVADEKKQISQRKRPSWMVSSSN